MINRTRKDAERLDRFKKNVRNAKDYFKGNDDRFNEFRRFVFKASLTDNEKALLSAQGKPNLEFNIIEAFISRLLGEFSKQEPSIIVSAYDSANIDPDLIDFVEQHMRHFICDADTHNVQYDVYKDLMSGGFSTFKLLTRYRNNKTFDQDIYCERVNPTLCGFDPMAKTSHKGDGQFCFEFRILTEEEFESEHPNLSLDKVKYTRQFEGFNWSFKTGNIRMLVLCEYYEKRYKKDVLVQLSTGETITESQYKELQDNWDENNLAPMPIIVNKRTIKRESIWRHLMYENGFIESKKTDFPIFPLIFVDNNSVLLGGNDNDNIEQFTRPYAYHAKGAQRFKNFAGNSLANEIENIPQCKYAIAKEALPKEKPFLDALTNAQIPNVVVYNAFSEQNPDMPIPNPIQFIPRGAVPPEIMQAFSSCDSLMQMELGSFDASLGINNNQLAGVAIVEGATQSNATAMPTVVGYLAGLQRLAEGYVKMMPKYYSGKRKLPIRNAEGLTSHIRVNQENGLPINYDEDDLNIKIEPGVNFRVQQEKAFSQMTTLMNVMPKFAQFMNEEGIPVLLDNMDFRGIDRLKGMADQWMQQQKQEQQQMMQMQQQQMQNNPAILKNKIEMGNLQLKSQELQHNVQKSQTQFQIDMANLQTDQNKVIADMEQSQAQNQVQLVKAQTEQFSKKVQLEIEHEKHELAKKDQMHRHAKDALQIHHSIKVQDRDHELKKQEINRKEKETGDEREESADME